MASDVCNTMILSKMAYFLNYLFQYALYRASSLRRFQSSTLCSTNDAHVSRLHTASHCPHSCASNSILLRVVSQFENNYRTGLCLQKTEPWRVYVEVGG